MAAKRFADLNEQEVLALAISNEEEDNRIYRSFADGLRACVIRRPRPFTTGWRRKRSGITTCCSISTGRNSAISFL